MYKEELKKLILKGILGFMIGFMYTLVRSSDMGIGAMILFGFIAAGIPYGWQLSNRVINLHVIGNFVVMILAFAFKLMIALIVGWIAYPIALIRCIIKVRQENTLQ